MAKPLTGTAVHVADLEGFKGDARLYRCTPPMKGRDRWYDEEGEPLDNPIPGPEYEYVIVSAAGPTEDEPETYIFGATEDWNVAEWYELNGSFCGEHDHEKALNYAGYRLVGPREGVPG